MRWSTVRVEAFSDGVLAIAITLLVLEVDIDPSGFEHLWRALADEWPSYLAYVTSFLTVGGVWIAHHALFSRLAYIDPVLMRLNLLLLMTVAFLPFPTALMADALRGSDDTERAAVIVYGGVAAVIELLIATASRYAAARPDCWPRARAAAADRPRPRRRTRRAVRARAAGRHAAVPEARGVRLRLVAALAVLSPRGEGR